MFSDYLKAIDHLNLKLLKFYRHTTSFKTLIFKVRIFEIMNFHPCDKYQKLMNCSINFHFLLSAACQVVGRWGGGGGGGEAGRPKLTWKKLTEKDCREWKLNTVFPQERSTWRSGVRSAMRAASQLSGSGPTDVDDDPAPAR